MHKSVRLLLVVCFLFSSSSSSVKSQDVEYGGGREESSSAATHDKQYSTFRKLVLTAGVITLSGFLIWMFHKSRESGKTPGAGTGGIPPQDGGQSSSVAQDSASAQQGSSNVSRQELVDHPASWNTAKCQQALSTQSTPCDGYAVIMQEQEDVIQEKLRKGFAAKGKSYPADLADNIDLAKQLVRPPSLVMQGEHEQLTIEELEQQIAARQCALFKRNNRKFKLLYGKSVSDLQASKEYRDSVFQVASNENGLEGSVSYGGSVSGLSFQLQGQTATFSCMGRAIYSMCYCKPINLTARYSTKVGDADAYKKLGIDLHTDIQVTNGASKYGGAIVPNYQNPAQRITQAVTFGLSGPDETNPISVAQTKDYLKAAYRGTLLSAVLKGKKKVVLTLIGGGVFKNPYNWIGEAVRGCKDLIEKYNLDVSLVIFDPSSFTSGEGKAFLDDMKKLEQEIVV